MTRPSAKVYAKGLTGMSFSINGSSSGGPSSQPIAVTDGHVSYAGADMGFSVDRRLNSHA